MMRRRRVAESAEAMFVSAGLGTDVEFQNALALWGRIAVPELSVVLVHLRALSLTHQAHHWQSRGDPFYGDHQMFERLYRAIEPEIDSVAERAVGAGGPENVDLVAQLEHALRLVRSQGSVSTIPTQSDLARRSLAAELGFLRCLDLAVESMHECGTLTRGTDNLLAGVEDVHEGHVYLLKQRVSSPRGA
jgi:DNA-binding ferritin-like protein